jgi:hypothetical protein
VKFFRVAALMIIPNLSWAAPQKVLFVGNSYTAFSGPESLEISVAKIHAERHPEDTTAVFAKYTVGGASFSAHLKSAESGQLKGILSEGWDIVVLQDQSQIPGFNQTEAQWESSRDAARELSALIEQAGAETRLFLTWGRHSGDPQNTVRYPDYSTMQDHLTQGYTAYADAILAENRPVEVVQVGEVWRSLHDALVEEGVAPTHGDTIFSRLYLTDGSHPSHLGTYLAACTFYASLMGESPVGIAWAHSDIASEDRDAVQQAVKALVLPEPADTESPVDTEVPQDSPTEDLASEGCGCSVQPEAGPFGRDFGILFGLSGLLILARRKKTTRS